jgi:hypothetical protein
VTIYRRRPTEVSAVQFLKAGDHPAVESRWVVKSGAPYWSREGQAQVWDECEATEPGAEEHHHLTSTEGALLSRVTPGDWIVTEGGETRVVTDEEFWRLYEMIDPIGQAVQRFLNPEALDWSDVK